MAARKKKPEDKNTDTLSSTLSLRDNAEEQLVHSPESSPTIKEQTPEELIHELQVHQIELEMQAEELRKSHLAVEESRDKFLDLYDFAPTGILTLSKKGSIVEVNLTGSTLLGVERSKLVWARFNTFVAPEDQDQWYWYITNLLQQEGKQYCTLLLKRAGGLTFPARLEGVLISGGINTEIRIAISDITDIWQAEDGLKKSEEQYRLLTDNSVSAIAMHEIVLDRKGKPVDSVFLSANLAFNTHTGLYAADVIGLRLTKVLPGIEKTPFLGICGKVVLTGEPATFEQYVEPLSRHFYVNVFKVGKGRFATVFTDITERKRVDDVLRLTQSRLDSAMTVGNIAWWEMDWVTGNVIFNERKAQMLGYPVEQFSHYSDFTQLVHPDDYQPIMQEMRDLISGIKKQYDVDYRIRTRNGEYLWFHDIGAISDYASDGSPSKVTGLVIDITERKRVEEALRESEERHRTILQTTNDGFWIIDLPKGNLTDVNETYCRMSGYTRAELLKMRIPDLDAIKTPDEQAATIKKIITNGSGIFETRHQKKDGSVFDVELSVKYQNTNGGRLICFCRDITERKNAEEVLRESEEKYRILIESAKEGVVIAQDYILVFANSRMHEILGVPAGDLEGRPFIDFIWPEDRELVLSGYRRRIAGEKVSENYDFRVIGAGGQFVWVSLTVVVIQWKGKPATLNLITDISERKKMEFEIQSLNRDLEQRIIERTSQLNASLEDKTVLLQEVHHRVRNNFQIIISLLSLQSQYIEDEKTKQVFKESKNRIHAMALVHEKLHSSTDIATIDLDNYFRLLGNSLLQFYGVTGRGVILNTRILDIHTNINIAIPIGLIVNELISNSLKHAFPDGRKGEISIAMQRENAILTIVYKDNGIGIPAVRDWRNINALGFHLVIALVEQLDGTIELDRTGGTTFTIIVKERE